MNNLFDDSSRRRALAGVLLVVAQVALTVIAFGPTLRSVFGKGFATATAESQLLLAVVVYRLASRRRDCLAPIALLLLFSGCAGFYICYVERMYPFLFTDTYFIPLLIAVATAIALRGARVNPADTHNKPLPGADVRTFSLRSLFVWIAVVALGILIGQGAILNTDVSGLSDPWESIEFAIIGAPDHFLFRLPLLVAALALYGFIWAELVRVIVSQDRGCRLGFQAAALFGGWFAGELILGACVLCFENPWPLLPVGMLTPVTICWEFRYQVWEGRTEFDWRRLLPKYAVLAACRVVVLGSSLVLLRIAGLRIGRREEPCT